MGNVIAQFNRFLISICRFCDFGYLFFLLSVVTLLQVFDCKTEKKIRINLSTF